MNKSAYLLTYILAAICAVCFIYLRRRGKKTKIVTVLRLLFHPKIWLSQSSLLDFKYFFAAWFLFPAIISYAAFSGAWVSEHVADGLGSFFGIRAAVRNSTALYAAVMALAIYLIYEFTYWLNHYICHRNRLLWEFHKVHHAAAVLTPLTVWRVHLIDTLLFANMVTVAVGVVQGVVSYAFGREVALASVAGSNLLLYGFLAFYGHLQHSQIWIPFRGAVGRIFSSPAHHQIHHSADPAHFNKNLGSSLAIFDWMFGTLCVPEQKDQKLTLGVENAESLNGFFNSTVHPFWAAGKQICQSIKNWRQQAAKISPARL